MIHTGEIRKYFQVAVHILSDYVDGACRLGILLWSDLGGSFVGKQLMSENVDIWYYHSFTIMYNSYVYVSCVMYM